MSTGLGCVALLLIKGLGAPGGRLSVKFFLDRPATSGV